MVFVLFVWFLCNCFTEMINFRAADVVLFNSQFNRDSFLKNAGTFLKRMPDCVPTQTLKEIAAKSSVVPLVLDWPTVGIEPTETFDSRGPLLMWNHRWEHDKDPEAFFAALYALKAKGIAFRLSLCGQKFNRIPACFEHALTSLADHIVDPEPFADKADYLARLSETDIVVSTAQHEFFGISVLEATLYGARPVVPDRLVYPELYADDYRYADHNELVQMLMRLCERYRLGNSIRQDRSAAFRPYLEQAGPTFRRLFMSLVR